MGGHLASINTDEDYQALVQATQASGTTSAVFIGAHEITGESSHGRGPSLV